MKHQAVSTSHSNTDTRSYTTTVGAAGFVFDQLANVNTILVRRVFNFIQESGEQLQFANSVSLMYFTLLLYLNKVYQSLL